MEMRRIASAGLILSTIAAGMLNQSDQFILGFVGMSVVPGLLLGQAFPGLAYFMATMIMLALVLIAPGILTIAVIGWCFTLFACSTTPTRQIWFQVVSLSTLMLGLTMLASLIIVSYSVYAGPKMRPALYWYPCECVGGAFLLWPRNVDG